MTGFWDNSVCMASTKNGRCHKKPIKYQDFCKIHIRRAEYDKTVLSIIRKQDLIELDVNIKKLRSEREELAKDKEIQQIINKLKKRDAILDDHYEMNLMGLSETWSNVPLCRQIVILNDHWDIEFIVGHFTQQLNHSMMENPYPIYPSSPYSRIAVPIDEINTLKKRIKFMNMSINIALKLFLNLDLSILKKCYMEANTSHDRYSSTLLRSLNEKLRFMLVNARNSQNAFTGYWVSRNNKITEFEELYNEWLDTPYQLISPVNYDILDNPQKDFLYTVLISTPPTEWGPSNDPTAEKL